MEAPGKPGLGQPCSPYQPATPGGGARTPSSSRRVRTSVASTSSAPRSLVTTTRSGSPSGRPRRARAVGGTSAGPADSAAVGDGAGATDPRGSGSAVVATDGVARVGEAVASRGSGPLAEQAATEVSTAAAAAATSHRTAGWRPDGLTDATDVVRRSVTAGCPTNPSVSQPSRRGGHRQGAQPEHGKGRRVVLGEVGLDHHGTHRGGCRDGHGGCRRGARLLGLERVDDDVVLGLAVHLDLSSVLSGLEVEPEVHEEDAVLTVLLGTHPTGVALDLDGEGSLGWHRGRAEPE